MFQTPAILAVLGKQACPPDREGKVDYIVSGAKRNRMFPS